MRIQNHYAVYGNQPMILADAPTCALVAPSFASAAQDVYEGLGTPETRVIQNSQLQRNAEKAQLPENVYPAQNEFNAKRYQDNLRLGGELDKLDRQMEAVACDPKLKPAERQKKLEALEKKKADIRKQIKPPVDMAQVNREVDRVMSDPNLSDDQKKKEIEAIRNRWGLPKRGTISMKTITAHLGAVEGRHAQRMREAQKDAQRRLGEIGKQFGVHSPQYLQAQARVQVFKTEADDSANQAGLLKSLYPKPKGFWGKLKGGFKKIGGAFKKVGKGLWSGIKKVGSFVGKIGQMVMPLVKLIPGVGQIAGLAWGGLTGLTQLIRGNWKGVLGNVLGMVPGLDFAKNGLGVAQNVLQSPVGQILGQQVPGVRQVAQVAQQLQAVAQNPVAPVARVLQQQVTQTLVRDPQLDQVLASARVQELMRRVR